ncbi:DUF599 domain-containing protein [Salibaculum griseiflavum]|uniref:DUF599 domain-containing protein n=1 Tax=Salibaculum griseiflavum TaxID=1914409 RepID=A0A2V1P818_9RHOB|nr:DUF599 domain-containing protein [Salibaculum griseiflavum]PWG18641.1 DUF599 domain-containing protein [Salibaculum griseiflavum]
MPATFADLAPLLTLLDLAAVLLLVGGAWIIGWRIEHPASSRPSVTVMMADHRLAWMQRFAERDNRIFDSQILANLRQSTTFFASSCLLAIGGVLALIGNVEPLAGLAEELHADAAPTLLWQLKLVLVALFLAQAFLRFVWSNRVFGYCAVLMGAMPNEPDHPEVPAMVQRATQLNVRAAINFNRGLRAMYFALGAAAWLVGPIPLMVASVFSLWVVWSREFTSIPRDILSR